MGAHYLHRLSGWSDMRRRRERLERVNAARMQQFEQPTKADLRETLAQAIRNTVVLQGKIDSEIEVER